MQFLKIFVIMFLTSLLIPSCTNPKRAIIPLGLTSVLVLKFKIKATAESAILIDERLLLNSSAPLASSVSDF